MNRIPFDDLQTTLARAMQALGFPPARAALSARLTAEATCDGVYTHGLNRFPRVISMVRAGLIHPEAEAEQIAAFGGLERWTGHLGVGNTNALFATDRAMELARRHGIGCVALGQTNHWMRGGTFGWHAANHGFFALCWTNTGRNLPAWGTTAATLGNNPVVLAVPRSNAAGEFAGGPHVVLDMAMSQFSYGQLEAYARRGEPLPVPGGYTAAGDLTQDPGAIVESMRPLPIGFWKGSGLALLLDLFAALLSGANATHQVPADPLLESGLSQVFLVIDPSHIAARSALEDAANQLIAALHAAPVAAGAGPARYPGERTLHLRQENLQLGVPVEDAVWDQVLALARG